jgi:hypothetical protein
VLRFVGLVFLLLGFAVLVWDLVDQPQEGLLSATGERWAEIDRESLLLTQAGVQRYVHPGLWDFAIQPMLEWPLAAELFALAGFCVVLSAIRRC